ncbi:amino acid permease [Euzebya tangerina]|uniref:amino acid permease n=1 Tax=Euzebya tangerina TaxID=591198 RepID=UPI00196B1B8E|nr:amino acid permease [Euzebya tangerina]
MSEPIASESSVSDDDEDGPDATPHGEEVTSRAPEEIDLRRPEDFDTADEAPAQRKKFGTFGGVFTPTLLTILGVIMYLREGWVIGNAGIGGGVLIILLAFGITTATALSMSSITTNIRIGAGGAYAIIAQSLGLEIGGALGIPRYLSQALAVTLYVFGFRAGWLFVFPDHPAILVDLAVFAVIVGIAYVSAGFAIKTQYVIMVVIAGSLLSILLAAATGSMQYPLENVGLWGSFPGEPPDFRGTTFWVVFAVFFPASTGIMAGANMSGDLKDPRRSIPRGTLMAIGVSLVIYLLLAVWLAKSATPEELVSNYNIMIELAFWGPAVVAGLLGATFSSALASVVGASRILMAMGEHKVLPYGHWVSRRTANGEPRNALLITAAIVVAAIMLRDLNAIAPLVTMFFLVTYAMLNGILLVEQSLRLISFRPALRVSPLVPLLGLAGSVFAMFIIAPTLALVSVGIMIAFYVLLLRRQLDAPFADVRSGLFVSLAEWASTKVARLPGSQERAWKPSLLIPVDNEGEVRGNYGFLTAIGRPNGAVKIMGVVDDDDAESVDLSLQTTLEELARSFEHEGVHGTATMVRVPGTSFSDGLIAGMQALRGTFFRPNALFLRLRQAADARQLDDADLRRVVAEAQKQAMGTLLWAPNAVTALGRRQRVNVWLRDRSPDWSIGWDIGNLDLMILMALKLQQNWDAEVRLVMAVEDPASEEDARAFLEDLVRLARVHGAEIVLGTERFADFVTMAPQADVSIFGLGEDPRAEDLHRLVNKTGSSCLFVRDSGNESALA